ncbi:hypothetical protein [Streptomyces macrosporus]|uniref:Helix-turn-helix domain-containing protein n=1 Tax=Streptomyces macrosporus TaxID=44032 RepID=A0ABP5X961_9ACTN
MSAHRITEESVVIGGHTALLMAVALRSYMRNGGFDRVHPVERAELDAGISALEAAGNASRQLRAVRGNTEAPTEESMPESSMSAREAAARLGVTPRHVRGIAPSLAGRKIRGVWRFDPMVVENELARRNRKT